MIRTYHSKHRHPMYNLLLSMHREKYSYLIYINFSTSWFWKDKKKIIFIQTLSIKYAEEKDFTAL